MSCDPLSSQTHASLLCHLSILLLEALTQALRALEELVDAAHHATFFLTGQALGCEVGNAIIEASLDKVRVHLILRSARRMHALRIVSH